MVEINIPFIRNTREFSLTSDDVVQLTARGKEAAENDAFGGARAQVLMTLNDGGATSIKELSSDTRLPVNRVKAIVADLMRRAEVRKVGYEG